MGHSMLLFKVASLVLFFVYYVAGHEIDDKNTDTLGHLIKVPRRFEIRGDNAKAKFKKYIGDIHDLTAGKNLSVIYKVKVELENLDEKMNRKRKLYKKVRSKKYNIPLKKQNMKLSNFEVLLRKLAEENGQKSDFEVLSLMTTKKPNQKFMTTKTLQLKYKPVVSKFKTNYTKIIRPVRNKIITLTV